jgi:hypothetical protein
MKSSRAVGVILLMAAAFCCWLAIRSGQFSGVRIANVPDISKGSRPSPSMASTVPGVLVNPQFETVLHAIQQRNGTHELAEPEVTTYYPSYYVNVNRMYYNMKFTLNATNR